MKIDRKDFLKVAGGAVVGGAAGFVFSGAPFNAFQWIVEWTQDQYVPGSGAERYLQSICQACPNACTVSVRMIGERAVKIETSVGGGCPIGQNLIQQLYHPDRVAFPMERAGAKGKAKFTAQIGDAAWNTAVEKIAKKIGELRAANKPLSIAAINGAHAGVSGLLLDRLVKACGSPHVYTEPCVHGASSAAVRALYNKEGSLGYDFAGADYILSFSARLFEGWGMMADMHKNLLAWKKSGTRLVQIDAQCTRTASLATEWVPLPKAGTEAVLAMGIAHLLFKAGKRSNAANAAAWTQIVMNDYTPDRVAKVTGVPEATLKKIADALMRARRPIAVAGRGAKSVSSSTLEIAAIEGLNSMLGGGTFIETPPTLGAPRYDAAAAASIKNAKTFAGLDEFIKSKDAFDVVFINDADPVYRSVFGKELAKKLEQASLVVAFTTLINDTAAYADIVLPTVTSLELPSVDKKTVVAPRYKAMHAGDAIIAIAKKIAGVADSFPYARYSDAVAAAGKGGRAAGGAPTIPIALFEKYYNTISKKVDDTAFPLSLIPFEVPSIGDGAGLALPYTLKSIDEKVYSRNKLWVHMNPETAKKFGKCEGSRVDLESQRGEVGSVRVHLTKTVAPDTVAVPLGFGHRHYTAYGEDKGVNPKEIMCDDIDPVSGNADWWFTRIKLS
ncbi:MAG TPA: molybdopterin-dependent oxidoreductase [Spirochaetota bacterium]|nr:molybdopterin-dependent oxidoreductase [Spirochaetota bacterium]HPU88822.1 molybdopterin-dependent oxidoreductase [Spirochaetota bacterium]